MVFSAKLTVSQPVQVKTHVGDPVELGEAGQQQQSAAESSAVCPPHASLWILPGFIGTFIGLRPSQTLSGRTEPRHIPPDIQLLSFNRPTPTFPHFDVWCFVPAAGESPRALTPDTQCEFNTPAFTSTDIWTQVTLCTWPVTDITGVGAIRPWTRAEGASVTADLHCAGELSVMSSKTR